ncbi:MAG: DUF362 domain-containing protein [Candidatus Cyclobacteriaceae bacterium M3_2C_046]
MDRRNFLRNSILGGFATAASFSGAYGFSSILKPEKTSTVALTQGNHRSDLAFRALEPFSQQIKQAIGAKKVVVKPNNVMIDRQLTATHVDTLEGILEFLSSIGKTQNVVIAESAAGGATFDGFENYGYMRLMQKYKVKLMDLDQEGHQIMHVVNEKDWQPHPVRMSNMMLDPNNYIISSARMKTHDRVVATLSLKNIVFGAPIKDKGFSWGPNRKEGAKNDKPIAHGGGYRGINYNTFNLAKYLHPHLALIDGFEGMEGDGPNNGTPVDHRVCVASPDWLAADRVALALMGIDFGDVGYLNYCYKAGMGEADLDKIEIVGERLADHVRNYKLNDNFAKQMVWKQQL